MKVYMKEYAKYIGIFILLLFFLSLIPLTGDDWGKGAGGLSDSIKKGVELWKNYNGRFFGNVLVVLLKGNFILKIIFQSIIVCLIIFFLTKYEENKKINNFFLIIILFFGMSFWMFRESILWLSGFVNYAVPSLCIAGYLYITKNIFDKTKKIKSSIGMIILSFIFGFFMNMFSEHSAIFSIILGITVILISKIIHKKIYSLLIAFLIGAIMGFIIMFASPVYWTEMPRLAGSEFNNFGFFEKIQYNLEKSTWLKDMVFKNLILNAIISGIFLLNIFKYKKILPKLVTILLALLTIIIFPVVCTNKFDILSNYIIQISLSIIYIISIIYLLFYNFYKKDNTKLIQLLFLFLSAFIAAAPLLLAFGIGPRCFLNSYILLILFVIILSNSLINKFYRLLNFLIISGSIIILSSYNYMAYENYKVSEQRMEIAKEAIEKDYLYLEMPEYPFYFIIHQFGTPSSKTGYHYNTFKRYYKLDPLVDINFVEYNDFYSDETKDIINFNNFIEIPTYDG